MIFGKHINKYYLKFLPLLLLGAASLLLVDVFQLRIPNIYGSVVTGLNTGFVTVDGTSVPFDMDYLLDGVCIPMLWVILAMVVGRFLWRVCFFGSAAMMESGLRRKMFDKCKDLPQEYYHVHKVGGLMSLFTNDIETIQECFGDGILTLCDVLLLGTLSFIKMWNMNVGLTLLIIIPMALLLAAGTVLGKYMMKKWSERQEAFSALSDFAQESFSGIAVIKAFVKEFKELYAFKRLNKNNEKANVAYVKMSTLLHIFVTLAVESVICIILGYGGYLVYEGIFDAGKLIEFIGYFSSIVWPIMGVSMLIEMRSRGKASLKRVSSLLDEDMTVTDGPGAVDADITRGEIEFRSLSFSFPGTERLALENVSFRVMPGQTVGIIGKTGSGKTTVADLILRTYNVKDGMLFIDGKDVNSLTVSSVRRACAYVPQDNFLFSDTIQNNIAFASDVCDIEKVKEAARLADIHGNITEFENGYSTVLGERGVTVSGGQKQRISIARALMKDAPILILDDSVSAVDTKTEKMILENLKTVRKGKTTLMIAHRVSTVENADLIVFIEEGRVLASGTHEELLSSCPEYRNTVQLQKLDEEKGEGEQ